MFRMIEVDGEMENRPTVVCNDSDGGTFMEDFFLSRHPTDIEHYAKIYDTVKDLSLDMSRLQSVLPSTDIGIQSQGANGQWYLYDFNQQIAHIQALVNMK